jgi:hypothetical protein
MDRQAQILNFMDICTAASTAGHGKQNRRNFYNYFRKALKIIVTSVYIGVTTKNHLKSRYQHVEKLRVGKSKGDV